MEAIMLLLGYETSWNAIISIVYYIIHSDDIFKCLQNEETQVL